MKGISYNIDERKPIWLVLSQLYLDTELQDFNFQNIANIINQSPYNFEQVKKIDRLEVFPILYANLIVTAGVWDEFDSEWLIKAIVNRIESYSFLKRLIDKIKYKLLASMNKDLWKNIESEYIKIRDK